MWGPPNISHNGVIRGVKYYFHCNLHYLFLQQHYNKKSEFLKRFIKGRWNVDRSLAHRIHCKLGNFSFSLSMILYQNICSLSHFFSLVHHFVPVKAVTVYNTRDMNSFVGWWGWRCLKYCAVSHNCTPPHLKNKLKNSKLIKKWSYWAADKLN